MKVFILALVICAVSALHSDEEEQAWKDFKLEHSKLFLSKNKEAGRKETFLKNRAKVLKLQEELEAGNLKYSPKLYEHADLTSEEFVARYGGAVAFDETTPVERTVYANPRQAPPKEFDSRKKGWLRPAVNQGSCNSCWAFAAIACVEVGYAMKGTAGLDLSEQQMVDCAKGDCNPSQMDLAFDYIGKNGAVSESDYPYSGVYNGKCKIAKGKYAVGTKVFPNPDADSVKNALMKHGALEIAIDCQPWQFYGGGVFHGDKGKGINHAVTLVGWGTENGEDYWLVRNSWGETFGEKGYIKLSTAANGGYNLKYTIGVNV